MRPRSYAPISFAAAAVMRWTAASSDRAPRSLTYRAITRGNAPYPRGCDAIRDRPAGPTSVSKETNSDCIAAILFASDIVCGMAKAPTRAISKKTSHASRPVASATCCTELPLNAR